ncbi:MAG: NADH-quinone oxidoreductase subunit C [Acidobacteria bacterium]|nr:NADH-quinone oxidoreductase subunit C [Acidobacteriota bacterium]
MSPAKTLPLHNGEVAEIDEVPVLALAEFRAAVVEAVRGGARLAAFFGRPTGQGVNLVAVLARDDAGLISVISADAGDSYPSLTPDCMQAHWFEREIAEQWGVRPEGHPWLKPIRFEPPHGTGRDVWNRGGHIVVGKTDFFRVEGEEIHEVAVGPVHAGVIEPGHFRFQCHGENVHHLEISLGYQHRGVERALVGGPTPRTIHYMETLAGDTTIGHGTAYSRAIESLGGAKVPARAQAVRGIGLELERIANHVGDLGAMAGDVGYLPTAAFCGRLRGDVLNMTALVCGSRFGRGLVRPGGAGFDLDDRLVAMLKERLDEVARDAAVAINLLWETPSVTARFEETGPVTRETCEAVGLVGPAARACGVERDVRHDFPFEMFRFTHIPVSTWHTGDVFARAYVRWLEVQRSFAFIREQLDSLPGGGILGEAGDLDADSIVVSLVEGWRGEICHVAMTDAGGRLAHYKVVDPSFHNWFGLACALRNQQISDFPLCNKSFNLSYCGHDL